MIVRIQLRCVPSSDAIPVLRPVVTHGLVENAPHLGSNVDAQQPPEPRLIPTNEDRSRHPAATPVKFFAVNNGLHDLCSKKVFIIRVHKNAFIIHKSAARRLMMAIFELLTHEL